MKLFSFAALLALLVPSAFAQVAVSGRPFQPTYDWPAVHTAGVLSTYLYTANADGAPSNFTIDAVTTGTAPSSCTFEVESSPDGVNWNAGTGSLSGSLNCNAAGVLTTSFAYKPVRYIRINITSYSGGDGTTAITFSYTRGATK